MHQFLKKKYNSLTEVKEVPSNLKLNEKVSVNGLLYVKPNIVTFKNQINDQIRKEKVKKSLTIS